jgi:hypothetical protein
MEKSKKKKEVILCVMHHRQNPSETTYTVFMLFSPDGSEYVSLIKYVINVHYYEIM